MAKKLKIKLPKRVAGVKIPKTVRKGPVSDFLNSSAGQIVIAEALVAAAGAFAIRNTDPDSPAGSALRHPVEGAKRAGRVTAHGAATAKVRAREQAERLSFALGEAVKTFRAAMEQEAPPEHAMRSSPEVIDVDAERAAKKKHSPSGEPRTPPPHH
jgi:hypothetical protein